MAPSSEDRLVLLEEVAHEMLDRWLGWLDEAETVPVVERPALAERDLKLRRAIAERDPVNALVERMYGKETEEALVRALWGGDRKTPRSADIK